MINKLSPVQIEQSDNWNILLIAKHILVAIMIFIHIYRNTLLSKRINKENEIDKKSLLQKLSLNLIRVVLILGLIVFLLSIIASKL